MSDPFRLTEPTCISFSGGRTSAYMLWRVLQAHQMSLPEDAVVCFANTGKEDEATLRFVQNCSERWGVHITWIEYQRDEPRRAAKFKDRNRIPLVTAGVTKDIVCQFWFSQPFDLELPNISGVTYHGNCDLCFLKGASQIMSLIAEKPERAVWWAKMEALALASRPSGAVFRIDRPSYAQMAKFADEQRDMFDSREDAIACFCGD